ncbi:MAG: DUF503 domain-containing protein [Planctomycetota bacterium]|nr:DUF503 domain-containing protein [Planctomycetota bacterium]
MVASMVIGVLQFELMIPASVSLKDKRRVVKSLKDRLHREHLVSVAEVGALDDLRRAVLAVAVASGEAARASEVMDRVVEKARSTHDARLGPVMRDMIHGSAIDWAESSDEGAEGEDESWSAERDRMIEEAQRLLDDEELAS